MLLYYTEKLINKIFFCPQVWFNNRGWIASVSYINVMNNLILRSNLPAGKDPADYSIVAVNHPMKMTKQQINDEAL